MEQSRNIERSEIWQQIYKEVKTLPIDAKGMDAPDAPSVTTNIEQLFLKLLPIHGVSVSFSKNDMKKCADFWNGKHIEQKYFDQYLNER